MILQCDFRHMGLLLLERNVILYYLPNVGWFLLFFIPYSGAYLMPMMWRHPSWSTAIPLSCHHDTCAHNNWWRHHIVRWSICVVVCPVNMIFHKLSWEIPKAGPKDFKQAKNWQKNLRLSRKNVTIYFTAFRRQKCSLNHWTCIVV